MQGIGPSLVAAALMYVCVGALFAVIPGDRVNRSFCRLGLLALLLGSTRSRRNSSAEPAACAAR
ncbi:hypothetical protein GXW82_36750 [Streptacidiphilus sp. 4-A2]|nr:hypothetical protein [Streptacidiphilus sp. 4-A2]